MSLTTRYFIAKCISFDSLRKAKETSIWACSDRKYGPQPKSLLREALEQGPVVLIYSVNNCHGWHGYANVLTPPGDLVVGSCGESDAKTDTLNKSTDETVWYRFSIHWHKLYLWEHGEQCLSFSSTESASCLDGTPVNKARNFQEISASVGQELCHLIGGDYDRLTEAKQQRRDEKLSVVTPFFQPENERNPNVIWQKLLKKVEGMGNVLLACVFGSQRYNLHTADSDVDMFVVYQAPSRDVLGFKPPAQTIKNRDVETCDYTVHEVHRYCELLLSGDPRCVETLFLHPSTITHASEQWHHLCLLKKSFLTSQCLEKYLRDATGSKGTKQLSKWESHGEMKHDALPKKVCKLGYIVLRLLQNARDIASGQELKVYREDGSAERELLMGVREGGYTYAQIQEQIKRLLEEIEQGRKTLIDCQKSSKDLETAVSDWLLKLRYESLKEYVKTQDSAGNTKLEAS